MQENPTINQQDRQKITFQGSAYPKEISQQCTPATHTEAVHCQRVLLGVIYPCLSPLKAPGYLGEGRHASRQHSWRQYPGPLNSSESIPKPCMIKCYNKKQQYFAWNYNKTTEISHWWCWISHRTDMLLLNVDPTLSSFHHATAVQGTEAKPVVDMVTASVDRPSVFLGVGDARRLDDDVLDVAPCQIPAIIHKRV